MGKKEIQTNIFFIDLISPKWKPLQSVTELKARGVLVNASRSDSPAICRVTHSGIEREDILKGVGVFKELLPGAAKLEFR